MQAEPHAEAYGDEQYWTALGPCTDLINAKKVFDKNQIKSNTHFMDLK